MRKLAAGVLIAGCMAMGLARAESTDVVDGMKNKAVRGVINGVTGIVELPMQTYKGFKNGVGFIKNKPASTVVGTILGFFRGGGHAFGRTAWGWMELYGFWTANAVDNDGVGIPLDAEYAWEWGEQYSIFKPSLKEGVKPYGRKLVRGLSDGFLGIAELPGQIVKGSKDGEIGKGALRGVWYWWSREVYGFGGILTCLVPNPEDNPGVAFNTDWPWSGLTE